MQMRHGVRNIIQMQDLPEWKILLKLSWPVVVSMLVQSLYNFVDSIYLSRLGSQALSAISLSFVVQNFVAVFFTGLATGINAVISRALGAGNVERARQTVFTGTVTYSAFSLVIMACSFWFIPMYFNGSSSDPDVAGYGISYLLPCMSLVILSSTQIVFERILQSSGVSEYMLICQIIGCGLNVAIDPVFIFGFGPIPEMGIAGAAYATLLGQLAASIAAILFNVKKNNLLFRKGHSSIGFDMKIAALICYIGIPSSAVGLASSISGYFINRILIGFSATANAAFGIYAKLENIAVVPGQGLAAGLVTLLAFFYGKRDFDRMRRAFVTGEIIIESWMVLCALLFIFVPKLPLMPFDLSDDMIQLTVPAVQIVGSTYILSGLMIGLGSFYQAVGKSFYTLFVALSRQLLVRIPIAFFLASFGTISLVWWCWPISEVISDLVNVTFFRRVYRSTKKQLSIEQGD